jgi:hypothetical protein
MAVTNQTVSTADFALKQYLDADVADAAYTRKTPLLALLRKQPSIEGNPMKIPMLTRPGGGVGSDYATVIGNTAGIGGEAFLVDAADSFGSVPFTSKVLKAAGASQPGMGSFIDWMLKETDAKLSSMGQLREKLLLGNGGGALARVTVSGSVLTPQSAEDVGNFYIGQQLAASTADGTSGALRTAGAGFQTVTAVDVNAGTVTLDGNTLVITTNDYVFLRGTWGGAQNLVKGLDAWFPATVPSSASVFFGVDRNGRADLCGMRPPTSEQVGAVVERFRRAATHAFTYGSSPGLGVCSPKQFLAASMAYESDGMRSLDKLGGPKGTVGYRALEIVTPYGLVDLMAAPLANNTRGFLLDLETVWISHLGSQIVEPMVTDGASRLMQSSTFAGWQATFEEYSNFVCNAPWRNMTLPLDAP